MIVLIISVTPPQDCFYPPYLRKQEIFYGYNSDFQIAFMI